MKARSCPRAAPDGFRSNAARATFSRSSPGSHAVLGMVARSTAGCGDRRRGGPSLPGPYALDFTPVSALLLLPLRYDPRGQFWSGFTGGAGEVLFQTELTITFGELLHAIFWEIGFHR